MNRFPKPSDRLCLNLVATVGGRLGGDPSERLARPADLTDWLATQGYPGRLTDEVSLAEARALREAVYQLLTAAWRGQQPRKAAIETVNTCAALDPPGLRWAGTGFVSSSPPDAAAALAAIADDAVRLLTGPDAARLHQCEGDSCATFFLLPTSARPRRWCAAQLCGNRARVTAHRRRTQSPR